MKIGVIGAMQEEINFLQKKLESSRGTSTSSRGLTAGSRFPASAGNDNVQVIAGCEFFVGSLNNKEIILLKSGVGKVSAALATTLMCQFFKPDSIINTGCAGGFEDSSEIGDIVIATELKFYDVDLTCFGYEFGQGSHQPPAYQSDNFLIDLAKKCNPKIKQGLIVSGDSFIHTQDQIKFILEKFHGAKAVDMESAAIAQICYKFNIPFIIIRAISDIVHHQESVNIHEQSLEKVSEYAAELVLAMLKIL